MVILIMGPPGVGKGTQAQRLCESFNLTHLSTGDILRAEVKNGTALGAAAKEKMDQGALVPDDLIIQMMLLAINNCAGDALLDGFPRTEQQATALAAAGAQIAAVIDLDASDDIIIERLSGRLVHPASGRTYHAVYSPPKTAGKDDQTGEDLVQRDDDKPDTVRARLAVYRKQTAPLRQFYAQAAQRGECTLISVNGADDINQVGAAITERTRAIVSA